MSIVLGKLGDPDLEDQLALDQFLVGVNDPELLQHMGEQPRMKSLYDALRLARDWERSEQHTQARKATLKLTKGAIVEPTSEGNDDRLQLMRQLDKERERNRQLQVNAEVDRRLRQHEAPRPPRNQDQYRQQSMRFEQSPRNQSSQPMLDPHQSQQSMAPPPSQQFPSHQPPNYQGNYPRQQTLRGNMNRGNFRGPSPGYQGGPPAQGPSREQQASNDVRRGPPPNSGPNQNRQA